MVFKGWALDPAGTKLIWENPGEIMPNHPVNLYAKWGEPDYKWKVTFDPNGGYLRNIKEDNLTTSRKKIQEGDIGQEEVKTFAHKEANDGDKQVFTVIQRQKLVEPAKPTKKGYDFMGWEVIRYKKDNKGDYTNEIDNSYRETYKVPELYSFGNDVVSPIYLKAIWVPNDRVDVDVVHHFLSLDLSEETKEPLKETLASKRAGYLVAASGDKQDEKYILANHKELTEKLTATYKDEKGVEHSLKDLYEEYNKRVGANNTYFQTFKVEPEKIPDPNDSSKTKDNPKAKDNVFHFFYRPFRTRDYKVNYIDERGKAEVEKFFTDLKLEDINKLMAGEEYKNADDKGKEAILLAANEGNKEKFEAKRKAFEELIKEYQIVDSEAVSNGNRHYDARNYRRIPGWVLADNKKAQQQLVFDVNEGTNEFLGINGTGADQVFFYYKDVRVIEVPKDGKTPDGYVRVTFKADKGGSFGKDDKGNDITELHYDVIKGLQSQLLPVPKELAEGETADKDKHYITPETGKKFIKWDKSPLLNDNTIIKEAHTFTAFFEWSGLSASGLVRTEAFKDSNGKWTNDFAPKIEDLKKQLVWMEKGEKKDLPAGAVIKLYDEAGNELTKDDQVYELVNEKKAADKDELIRTVNVKAKVTFTDGKDPQELDIPIIVYKNVYEALNKEGDKPLFLSEAEKKEAKDGGLKDIIGDYVKVTVAPTGDMNSKDNKVYYVNKNAWVEIKNYSNGTAALINWTANQDAQNDEGKANGKFDFAKRHKFTEDTVISPRFSQTSELVVHESYKDSKNNWVNDFIDSELTDDKIKAAIQVKNGSAVALGADDKLTIVDEAGNAYADDAALKAALYEKLQEKDDSGKVSRIENIKVKVEYANGEVQTLTVPVKVIKNIYEAKTESGKPDYVPANYVKVTLDPTTKAKDPQKYFYYVNPDAKVLIPGKDPVGVKEAFTRWTMKADSAAADEAGETYKLKERHQFAEASTITAQYEEGKIKIIYVDDSGKEIDPKYHIYGVEYPSEKFGKLNTAVNEIDLDSTGPKFKGYFFISRDPVKGKNYKDPADPKLDIVTYQYNKKITTDDKSTSNVYFPVVFDANTGAFTGGEAKVTVYVYFDGNEATPEPVTFEEIRQAVEEKYGKPSKTDENFIEWQDKAKSGSSVADDYEIKFKGWDQQTYEAIAEVFYANYGKASALVKYLDLNGKAIADEFKIDGVEYPTEKAGTADEAIASDVFTADSAPKFTGYKFNRIELNPKDGKYALTNKATIKIYYEKDLDVIPAENGTEKPDGYVEVKFVPTDKAKDATEKIFYVNPTKEVTIPIANPEGAQYYTFKEWKMGANADGAVYNPKTPQKFTEALTTITATYTSAKNIIPYDPSATDPMPRPDGYVRVSFAADKGLKLTEQKAYYVKKNAKDAAGNPITLGNAELVKPGYTAETGYEFTKWDNEDTLEIKGDDVLVTAKAKVLADVDTVNHPGYVKVTFKAGANGVIKENGNPINEKVYYVNPNKYVNLKAPTPEGNTGYDFAAWKSDKSQGDFSLANFVNYKEDTTITAMFNQKDAVYPKLKGSTKPAGYVEVTFAITGTNGKIAENEVKTYYVDPTRQVSLKAPKTVAGTGFIFDKWRLGTNPTDQIINPADQRQYSKDTTIYGSFTKLKDIIPATNDDGTPNLQPVDYVTVLFIGGDHANSVDGQILYYVNPKAGKTIGDVTKPTVTPDVGWEHTGWDVQDPTEIKDYIFVVAEYKALADVIEKVDANTKKPAGYVTVTFKSGANGKIQEKGADITEKVYYVNPAKYVHLTPPDKVPNTSFEFSTWESDDKDLILANNIRFTKDTIITAKFNPEGNVIPKTKPDGTENAQPAGFVKVTFVIDPATGGKIVDKEVTVFYVNPNKDVTVPQPKTTAETGYEFEKWSIDTTEVKQYTTDTTVKGKFKTLDPIIPNKNPDGTVNAKPEGYVIVNFLRGQSGYLGGKATFYVNPKAGKTLADLKPEDNITVVPNPTYKFDKWDQDLTTVIDNKIDVTALYTQLPNIIKAGPKDTAPAGYVVIIFETDGNGTITGNAAYEDSTNPATNETEIVYFVNPDKGVKLADATATASRTLLPVPSTTPNDSNKYKFDNWRKEIDTINPIIRGRVHIAMFKPKEVTLTYDANKATGTVPPVLTVDYGTSVRLANQGNLKKKDASFAGWTIDGTDYKVGEEITLTKDSIAYAKWTDDKNIIEYNPVDNPTTRPDTTYARVTFAVYDGLKLKEQKAYYVKKDAGIKLGDTNLVKPGYDVKTGYKFDKWDKEDSLVITEDILVTAKAIKLDTVIPEKDKNGNTNAKPEGYKEVVFKVKDTDATKGSLEGVTKFYVNPTEYVTINPPTTKANTGFEFGVWDKDATRPTVYTDDLTTITASFNGLKDVIPKTNLDGSENKQPAGYKKVEFVIDPSTGGKIADKEITVYYVNPDKEVTVPQPKTKADTGYEFEKWDQDTATAKKYTDDTTVKGNFKKLDDIVDGNKPKPDAYITVTFDKGEHGTLSGQKVYYVNPKADKTIADLRKPTITAETGWKQKATPDAWDTLDSTKITGPADIVVKAQYDPIPDVIEEKPGVTKPEGYITVTFSTETNGKIKGTTNIEKVVYVNPNKAHELKSYAPTVDPNTGFDFANWDTQIDKRIQYSEGDTIKALYNTKGNVIPQKEANGSDKPAGYVKVIFAKGEHGELSGQTVYYVNPNNEVTVPAPIVTASIGWKQKTGDEAWDQKLTQTFTAETTTITAKYDPLADVVPQEKTDKSDKPFGYITVRFEADANGSLSGNTVYYVNPEKTVDLTDKADAITKNPNTGYTAEDGTWKNSDSKNLNDTFNKDTEFIFNFAERPNVIEKTKGDESEKPAGYVRVTLKPTDKATDETKADKVYFVNPLKENVNIPSTDPVGREFTDANSNTYTFLFKEWTVTKGTITPSWEKGKTIVGTFTQDTDITAKYNIKAENITNGPIPKENVVTAINDVPKARDLIKNIPGSSTDPLPNGTTIEYTPGGEPKVDETGKTTAKVEVKYPNGKTTIVTVPVTVVDNVVPQLGNDKPLVPGNYVKVIVDTTVAATDNTYFVKTFWVKPSTEVWIPVNVPTGKEEAKDGVMKTNNFINWVSDDSGKTYKTNITDEFTKEETYITAKYEFNKNIEPQGKHPLWFALNSNPEPKEFIKNVYDDSKPDTVGTLPPGTKFAFKLGTEPNTGSPEQRETTIVVTYPNGEVKEIPVEYKVTGDVVEEEPGLGKPTVPDNFVRIIVRTEELPEGVTVDSLVEPEDVVEKAVEGSKFTRTFWVDSTKPVTIPVNGKEIVGIKDNSDHRQWIFDHWQGVTSEKRNYGDNEITGTFLPLTPAPKDTTYYVLAKYIKAGVPIPSADYVVTDVGVYPRPEDYKEFITGPQDIISTTVIIRPDVSKPGRTRALIEVEYKDGTKTKVWVQVYVQRPGETNTRIVYRDRIVEKEKIVEKIVKIKDNQRLKEVRFMQGFEGKFRPHDGLTRAEAAQILANALKQDGYKYNPAYPISYKDVKQKWYTQAIVITTQANVFKGYDDGYFRPEEKISRAEWVATLKRFQQLQDADGNRMGLKANHWATREVEAAYEEGWLQIYTNGNAKFNANEPITREEVAAVTNRAFGRLIDRTYIMRNDKSVINYKDINPSMWSYVDILCASNSFIHDENVYMSHGIEYIKTIVNNIEGTIIFNVQLKNLEIIQDKFQRYLR